MSYDLLNPSTRISRKFTRQFWAKTLELAQLYGWRCMGTCPPSEALEADWLGGYLTNDGQMLTVQDASSLADALEKSLDDIPDVKTPIDWNAELQTEDDLPEWLSPEEREIIQEGLEAELFDVRGIHPFEFFAGDEKHSLMTLIRFCRLGSFIIS